MTMEKDYEIVCEWLHEFEQTGEPKLSQKELDNMEWHRKRMRISLDFLITNPMDAKRSLYETDFFVSFKEIRKILKK